jgi:TetR/AcrR family transcriptional repressor of mexJK operon
MAARPDPHVAILPARRRGGGRHPAAALQERERDLLDVAKQLFVRDSYHQVSIATIATTVRVATKTIYDRFGGKHGLLRAVVERDVGDWRRQVEAVEASGADLRTRLEALACLLLRRALSEQRARLHADAVAERSPELAALVAPVAACDRELLERLMAELRASGATPAPAVLGDAFVGCVLGRHIGAIGAGAERHADGEQLRRMAAAGVAGFLALAGCAGRP